MLSNISYWVSIRDPPFLCQANYLLAFASSEMDSAFLWIHLVGNRDTSKAMFLSSARLTLLF